FFFQAEDGIRDFHVTGVQTCALPISTKLPICFEPEAGRSICASCLMRSRTRSITSAFVRRSSDTSHSFTHSCLRSPAAFVAYRQIGRASCRERVEIAVPALVCDKQVE